MTNFLDSVKRMKERNATINDEYYVDTAINDAIAMGLRCAILEIDSYICWGTPDDLNTFKYSQSCFNIWDNRPWKLTNYKT